MGLLAAAGVVDQPLWLVLVVFTVCAIVGNVSGYAIGRAIGPPLFRPRAGLMGKLFKQEYVQKTHRFFERYGNRALILARFVPLVRTFVTLVAGVGKMDFRHFITYTAIGGVLWVFVVTIARLLPRRCALHSEQHRSRAGGDRGPLPHPDGHRIPEASPSIGIGVITRPQR